MILTSALSSFLRLGHWRAFVYSTPVHNVGTLHRRALIVCQTICNYPRIFERVRQSMIRRAQACIKSRGGHFALLINASFQWCNLEKKSLRTHICMNFIFLFWYAELPSKCVRIVVIFKLLTFERWMDLDWIDPEMLSTENMTSFYAYLQVDKPSIITRF